MGNFMSSLKDVGSAIKDCFKYRGRRIEQRMPEGDYNPPVGGLGRSSYSNPLGRVSIQRPSPADLEKASVVTIKH